MFFSNSIFQISVLFLSDFFFPNPQLADFTKHMYASDVMLLVASAFMGRILQAFSALYS